jgi:hypothetical protein
MPVLAKLVEMRAISMRPAGGAPRAETKPNVRCPSAVPLHLLQPVPEPSGDIISDRSRYAKPVRFSSQSEECSGG